MLPIEIGPHVVDHDVIPHDLGGYDDDRQRPRRSADLLFRIVSKRHESRAVVITTNLAYKQWGTVFGDAPCVGAWLDRFAQHCHMLDIDADSWRDKEWLEKKGRAPRPRR